MAEADSDPQETQEWLEALDAVIDVEGVERSHYLLEKLIDQARRSGVNLPYSAKTAYINTIPPQREVYTPGNPELEWRIRSINRWNAMAMVVKANLHESELGGHIASYASAATLYEVGFNHFWHAPSADHGGDLVYFQGHSAPGIYARAFLEGRLDEQQLNNFRQEVDGGGLSSYPHPWLMPDFWQFPTVSMGLGPDHGDLPGALHALPAEPGTRRARNGKVWAFMGDGEMDEPEALGAMPRWPREKLDNLIFVINCNLQRLDGPVRGNGKIIQELETIFRGAGWNVLKVIWGAAWDPLLAKDATGLLQRRWRRRSTATTRPTSVERRPTSANTSSASTRAAAMVASLTDDDIRRLDRGGHDPAEGLRGLRRGGRAHRPADRHPGQDRQGLRHGRGRRGQEHHTPAEEDGRGGSSRLSRSLQDPDR